MTDPKLLEKEKKLDLEYKQQLRADENARRDAQRNMAWFALFGMLLYPFAVILSSMFGLDNAAKVLGDMAPTYFLSVAAIVAAFYGKEHFDKKSG